MSYLVDSNILTRLTQKQSPHHPFVRNALISLRRQNEEICIVPQNLIEFWAVATRPVLSNGLGLMIDQTKSDTKLRKYNDFFAADERRYSLIFLCFIRARPRQSAAKYSYPFQATWYEIKKFKRLFNFYDGEPKIFAEWENLVMKY